MRRVGYWMSEKKKKRLNFEDHIDIFRNAAIELIKINIDKSLEGQGPFDLILHKCTHLMVEAEEGDKQACHQINNIKNYIASHPECVLVDSFDSIKKLIDRNEQYKLLLQCNLLESDSCVFTPTFVELTTKDVETNKKRLKDANVGFPFVCKPIVAHGTTLSHQMAIIFDERGLTDVQPPCVAQTFLNHSAVLFKVFVIGDEQFVVERPSLKNFSSGDQATIFFDSSNISKPNCANFLTELDAIDLDRTPVNPDHQRLKELARVISGELKMELFGIDVIIDCDTKKYAVIDINAFPGYEGVDNFIEVLCKLLNSLMDKNEKAMQRSAQQSKAQSRKRSDIVQEVGEAKRSKLAQPQVHNGDKNGNSKLESHYFTQENKNNTASLKQWDQPINGHLPLQ